MPNPYYGEFHKDRARKGKKPPPTGKGGGGEASVKENVGFPGVSLPGKAQPKDRSAGVPRVKACPQKIGL